MENNSNSFKIVVVFDNICVKSGYMKGFGFSALVMNKKTKSYLLFDTGGDTQVLLHNLNQFGVSPNQIEKVMISHNHHDHAGGLDGIYSRNKNIHIYVPRNNRESFKRSYSDAKVIGVSDFTELEKNIYSSGQLGSLMKEQALFLKTQKGEIVILSGCAHPGLEQFIIKAREEFRNVKAVIGGFHGFNKFSYLEDIDIIGACHCTRRREEIEREFPDQFRKVCVGTTFDF
ncbi:MAG: MBL fold metallo-hydrolase [Promethearchaeota archaeon]